MWAATTPPRPPDGAVRSHTVKTLADGIAASLGARVVSSTPLSASHGCATSRVALDDGRALFVKCGPSERVDAEARDLAWIAETHTIRTPCVLAVLGDPAALVMEWLEPSSWRGPEG